MGQQNSVCAHIADPDHTKDNAKTIHEGHTVNEDRYTWVWAMTWLDQRSPAYLWTGAAARQANRRRVRDGLRKQVASSRGGLTGERLRQFSLNTLHIGSDKMWAPGRAGCGGGWWFREPRKWGPLHGGPARSGQVAVPAGSVSRGTCPRYLDLRVIRSGHRPGFVSA